MAICPADPLVLIELADDEAGKTSVTGSLARASELRVGAVYRDTELYCLAGVSRSGMDDAEGDCGTFGMNGRDCLRARVREGDEGGPRLK